PTLRGRCCLLVMGSEGRGEQLLKTDQDNALVLADDLPQEQALAMMQRFRAASAGWRISRRRPCNSIRR
ncbi:DUF294 nucleotidyltransferase-like domain-containing protein, partial [Escherichia coli]|uniref:DUF294 nucleotidyltransferase-like domain-containing protein n=1 Tax=Escherichia coli TaxID=562 RepID=UPI001BD276D2